MESYYVEALKLNDKRVVENLYKTHRIFFLNLTKPNRNRIAEAIDIYQDAFVILRKHALSGKLDSAESNIQTYLMGICKNLIYKIKGINNRRNKFKKQFLEHLGSYKIITLEYSKDLSTNQKLIQQHYKDLEKNHQRILTLSLYYGLSTGEITKIEGFKNEATMQNQKDQAIKTLKDLIKKTTPE